MNRAARKVLEERGTRNAARAAFDNKLAQVRQDLEARGVGGRIADKVGETAKETMDEAVELARENQGVIAGTIAALAIWFMRNPIISWLEGLLGADADSEKERTRDEH